MHVSSLDLKSIKYTLFILFKTVAELPVRIKQARKTLPIVGSTFQSITEILKFKGKLLLLPVHFCSRMRSATPSAAAAIAIILGRHWNPATFFSNVD